MKDEVTDRTKQWAADRFGITPNDILGYHSGICYSRVMVSSKEAADKVTEKVTGKTVNGGMFHGLGLGSQSKYDENRWEVMV